MSCIWLLFYCDYHVICTLFAHITVIQLFSSGVASLFIKPSLLLTALLHASPYLWNHLPSLVPCILFCSLSSWFTSSCTHHLITVPILICSHHLSLPWLHTLNSSVSQILSSIVFLVLFGSCSRTGLSGRVLPFVCFSFFFLYIVSV